MDKNVTVRVWDLPTRLFHWVLAASVAAAIVSARIGGDAMQWHFRFGYAVFTLLLFRLFWGVMGGHWSRFASFAYTPAALLRYVRGQSAGSEPHGIGHSPPGAWWIFAALAVLALQVGSGLFADDEIAAAGPLIQFVSGATSSLLTAWHTRWGQWLILALIALHLGAIVFYLLRRGRNLVGPMWNGDKSLADDVPASADHWRSRSLALILVTLCGVGVAWLVGLGE